MVDVPWFGLVGSLSGGIIDNLRDRFRIPDLLIYCWDVGVREEYSSHELAIKHITAAFGVNVWKRAVFLFTNIREYQRERNLSNEQVKQ